MRINDSEGPPIETMDPSTPRTVLRATGFLMLTVGMLLVLAGLAGLLFFFMVPALVFVVMGAPLVVIGGRWFSRGAPRLARGPGRAG
jgi:hypothetical protein